MKTDHKGPEYGSKCPNMAKKDQNGKKQQKMAKDGKIWPKMVLFGKKYTYLIYITTF